MKTNNHNIINKSMEKARCNTFDSPCHLSCTFFDSIHHLACTTFASPRCLSCFFLGKSFFLFLFANEIMFLFFHLSTPSLLQSRLWVSFPHNESFSRWNTIALLHELCIFYILQYFYETYTMSDCSIYRKASKKNKTGHPKTTKCSFITVWTFHHLAGPLSDLGAMR